MTAYSSATSAVTIIYLARAHFHPIDVVVEIKMALGWFGIAPLANEKMAMQYDSSSLEKRSCTAKVSAEKLTTGD